jgi:3'-phosphoadenosine 5'-phosphosulfate sulfotransferase (PAPS reductase)/FAD synthetase
VKEVGMAKAKKPNWLDENEMTVVDLASYDYIIVNSSAGKDSQAMLSGMVCRCDDLGIDHSRIIVVHADLGRVEWDGTKELAKLQAEMLGLRFEVISREQGDLLDHVESRGMWPDSVNRYCTSDHKRDQISRIFTKLSKEFRQVEKRQVRFLNCMGIRSQESAARAKKTPFEHNTRASTKTTKFVDTYYPIFDWTVEQVWAEIERSGLPHHGAYDLGMTRLSCVFCIFAPKSMLMIAGAHNRALLDEYVRVEQKIGHTFRAPDKKNPDGFKIESVRDALDADASAEILGDEDIQCWDM